LTILEHSQPQPPDVGRRQRVIAAFARTSSSAWLTPSGTPQARLDEGRLRRQRQYNCGEILNRLASEGFVVAEGQARVRGRTGIHPESSRTRPAQNPARASPRWTESFRAGRHGMGRAAWFRPITKAWRATERAILSAGDDPELSQTLRQRIPSSPDIELRLTRTHANSFSRVRQILPIRLAVTAAGATIEQHRALLELARLKTRCRSRKVDSDRSYQWLRGARACRSARSNNQAAGRTAPDAAT